VLALAGSLRARRWLASSRRAGFWHGCGCDGSMTRAEACGFSSSGSSACFCWKINPLFLE
jgi:hypothetical protein